MKALNTCKYFNSLFYFLIIPDLGTCFLINFVKKKNHGIYFVEQ